MFGGFFLRSTTAHQSASGFGRQSLVLDVRGSCKSSNLTHWTRASRLLASLAEGSTGLLYRLSLPHLIILLYMCAVGGSFKRAVRLRGHAF